MRIGIDCRALGAGTPAAGIAHYIAALVRHLLEVDREDEFVLFFDAAARTWVDENFGNFANARLVFVRSWNLPFLGSHLLFSRIAEREKFDVFHGAANMTPFGYRGRTVVTVHDLAIYDHPEWFPARRPFIGSLDTKLFVPDSIRRASKILAVSEHTKRSVMRRFWAPAERIDVTYPGVDHSHAEAAVESGRYVLFVGTLEPRKNIATAVDAFVAAMGRDFAKFEDMDFVIAGALGWHYAPILEAIDRGNAELASAARAHDAPPRERIRYVGRVDHDRKFALMRGCSLFLFPSLHEGFGLPVLEAMSCGKPVIAGDSGALPEVCGDAAVLVDPNDLGVVSDAVSRLLNDPVEAADLGSKAARRAALFDWYETAHRTIEAYKAAVLP